jgi:hypothetical protein
MLLQHDDNNVPSSDEAGRSPATSRPCLRVEPWLDPVIDNLGHDPRSAYVETFWLPVLGPSTTWLLRHLTTRLEESPEGVELDVDETARSLGLGERLGPNAPFARTLKRCVDFGMAEWRGPLHLAVRRRLPPLARRHLRRLPESLQARHDAAADGIRPVADGIRPVADRTRPVADRTRPTPAAAESLRRQACKLALSLVDLGEDQQTTEQQLRRLKFHPSLATECAAWAVEEQARRARSAPA